MERYYYSAAVSDFLVDDPTRIFGELTSKHSFQTLTPELKNSWHHQIEQLRVALIGFDRGQIFFEFSIPRMGKRVDNILILDDRIFVIEFKVGYENFDRASIDQVVDYTVDLKNFHEGSHEAVLLPILVVTGAPARTNRLIENKDRTFEPLFANGSNLREVIEFGLSTTPPIAVNVDTWAQSRYKPTPTIVEAAQALYAGHTVDEIARTDDNDSTNLTITSECIQEIIDDSYESDSKAICFVTGVPGAGKTLAGLNIAIRNMEQGVRHATYMSGNGPLVQVLREALSRNRHEQNRLEVAAAVDPENGIEGTVQNITLGEANDWAKTIIQAIHEFRADQMGADNAPIERVVIFDESQRAWTMEKLRKYLGATTPEGFNQSEPHFLIGEMNRHDGFCTIVCLVGGGQEIHDGEAGLEEWFRALQSHFPNWKVYYSDAIIDESTYLRADGIRAWLQNNGTARTELHLEMPMRSFRSNKLASFVEALLEGNVKTSKIYLAELERSDYPIRLTRNIETARFWLKDVARGTNRIGLVASSGGIRLKPFGIFVKNKIKAADWFLKGKDDVRSSYYLEDVATEFDIQGLELDWVGVCWDGDLYFDNGEWRSQFFSGSSWKRETSDIDKRYLMNTYRVLLTRARQGMVIFVPKGDESDPTRPSNYYDGTYNFLKNLGMREI